MLLVLLLGGPWHAGTGVHAQDGDACPVLVTDALRLVGTSCAGLGRNEACYGHTLVAATFQEGASASRFEVSGDVAALTDLAALVTKPADPDAGTWGVALMKVRANLPDEGNAALTLVLFGDTEVTNRGAEVSIPAAGPTCLVRNEGGSNINVRGGPGTVYGITDVLAAGDEVVADGRSPAGDWVRIALGEGTVGWVYVPLVTLDCAIDTLAVVEEESGPGTPVAMRQTQAFSLRTGHTSACEQAPDGLLIDAPPGQRATVMVNGVQLTFASAAFLTAFPDDVMAVQGLTGSVEVTAFDQTVTVTAGEQTTVPLTGLDASGPPTPLEAVPDLGVLPGLRRSVIYEIPFEVDTASDTDLPVNVPNLKSGLTFNETFTVTGVSACQFGIPWAVGDVFERQVVLTLSDDGRTLTYPAPTRTGGLDLVDFAYDQEFSLDEGGAFRFAETGVFSFTGTQIILTDMTTTHTIVFTSDTTYALTVDYQEYPVCRNMPASWDMEDCMDAIDCLNWMQLQGGGTLITP